MLFYGLGQDRDEQQALSWYKKAAALGNGNALYAAWDYYLKQE